jgi:hypothetical protein
MVIPDRGVADLGIDRLLHCRLTEMMLMSTSRRGLTHRLTDFGSSTGFVGLGREVLVHSLDVAL